MSKVMKNVIRKIVNETIEENDSNVINRIDLPIAGKHVVDVKGYVGARDVVLTLTTGATTERAILSADHGSNSTAVLGQIDGDLEDLVGDEIVAAYMTFSQKSEGFGSFGSLLGVTFVHIRTRRNDITLHWSGDDSQYYSASVEYSDGNIKLYSDPYA
jgi:hypothetical protein